MAPVKFITSPATAANVDGDFSNMNLDVGTAVLLMVASTNGQVKRVSKPTKKNPDSRHSTPSHSLSLSHTR
jgi:hypothetical protein